MLKKVTLTLVTERCGVAGSLFDDLLNLGESASAVLFEPLPEDEENETERLELFCDGRLRLDGSDFSLTYDESALTDMQGTQSQLSFRRDARGLLTMLRTGSVTTALVFEQGKRHMCVYRTPYMTFEVCVQTLHIDNRLAPDDQDPGGTLDLDYLVEIRGACAERCRLHLEVKA